MFFSDFLGLNDFSCHRLCAFGGTKNRSVQQNPKNYNLVQKMTSSFLEIHVELLERILGDCRLSVASYLPEINRAHNGS